MKRRSLLTLLLVGLGLAVAGCSTGGGSAKFNIRGFTIGLNSITKTEFRTNSHVTELNVGWLF